MHLKNLVKLFLPSVIGTLVLLLAPVLFPTQDFLRGGLLIVTGCALYFVTVYWNTDKNWMDLRALFSAIWIATIGLTQFRLLNYQEIWQQKTWLCVALSYLALEIGMTGSIAKTSKFLQQADAKQASNPKKFKLTFHENRYFWICVIGTLISFLCFCYSIYVNQFLPFFHPDPSAYARFSSKLHLFSVAFTMVSGLCYYCIKTQPLSTLKKAILWVCIVYSVLLFPILIVSRGIFIMGALNFSTVVFFLHKKKFSVFFLCCALMLGIYGGTSLLRNYTEEYLMYIFEPKDFIIDSTDSVSPSAPTDPDSENQTTQPNSIRLPGKVAFFYSYLTSSHDNFNEAVQNNTHWSLGLRQLSPFNLVLQSDRIEKAIDALHTYQVKTELNMTNLIASAYYDFGVAGVIIFPLLWGLLFGCIQSLYENRKNIFLLMILGNTMLPITLCFFGAFMSNYVLWVRWGTVLLLMLSAVIPNKTERAVKEQ